MLKSNKLIGGLIILFIVVLLILFLKNDRLSLELENKMPLSDCLPANIILEDIVSAEVSGYANGNPLGIKKVTVEQKLSEIGAFCKEDKLLDSEGREISFYFLKGCWGNPPRNYTEIIQQQMDEINLLKEKFTLIEMTCNPSGMPIV